MKTSTLSFGKYIVLSILALGMSISSCKKEEEEVTPNNKSTVQNDIYEYVTEEYDTNLFR